MNGSGMTHDERLALAGRLKDLILDRYGELVLAVFVTSSTARGLDLAFSDLELTAVHRDSSSAASQSYYYRGVLVEVEHIEESRILERARTVDHSWPVKAGGYRDRIQLFERDGWMQQLDEVLSARDAGDFMRAHRSAMLTLREDMDKLRNARLMGDDLNVRVFGFFTAYNAANVVLFLNRRAMITTRMFFQQAFDCPEQPAEFRWHLERLLGVRRVGVDEVAQTAESLATGLADMSRSHGIVVESEELLV